MSELEDLISQNNQNNQQPQYRKVPLQKVSSRSRSRSQDKQNIQGLKKLNSKNIEIIDSEEDFQKAKISKKQRNEIQKNHKNYKNIFNQDCNSEEVKDNLSQKTRNYHFQLLLNQENQHLWQKFQQKENGGRKILMKLIKNPSYKKDPRIMFLLNNFQKILNKDPSKKLKLILDVDDTLLHVIDNTDQKVMNQVVGELKSIKFNSPQNPNYKMHLSLRPGVPEFIKSMSQYYEISIYSHGKMNYIQAILDQVLDKDQIYINRKNLFASKGEITGSDRKDIDKLHFQQNNLLNKILILDDIFEVWQGKYHDNLISTKKFTPFHSGTQLKNNGFQYFTYHTQQVSQILPQENEIYFMEKSQIIDKEAQIPHLQDFLAQAAIKYYTDYFFKGLQEKTDIRQISKDIKSGILQNLNIIVIEQSDINYYSQNSIPQLCQVMGASVQTFNLTDLLLLINQKQINNTNFILSDIKQLKMQYSRILNSLQQNDYQIPVACLNYATDCWFFNKQIPIQNYIYTNQN